MQPLEMRKGLELLEWFEEHEPDNPTVIEAREKLNEAVRNAKKLRLIFNMWDRVSLNEVEEAYRLVPQFTSLMDYSESDKRVNAPTTSRMQ